jgi:hypothetical protein
MKQTAVEWLIDQFKDVIGDSIIKVMTDEIQQAKEMEKQQIIDAYTDEDNNQWDKQIRTRAAEQYYNQTFKSK